MSENNFLQQTTEQDKISRVKKLFSFLTGITHKQNEQNLGLKTHDKRRISKLLEECLSNLGGDVATRERAAQIGQSYLELNKEGRREILLLLASLEFDTKKIISQINNLLNTLNDKKLLEENIYQLKSSLNSPRTKILKQFNFLEEGLSLLVEMREDLITFIDEGVEGLENLEKDFVALLSSWFDVGFLNLEKITWDSPASLLQKLIIYEAVHKINSWSDLQNRLDNDRRCYAFFHQGMKDTPLIFIEVALVDKISDNVQDILNESLPTNKADKANTAIFYSISNTQVGLRGVSFGNFLIKKVVSELKKELPNLKTFATLSPVPGFVSWLKKQIKNKNLENIVFSHIKLEKDSKSNTKILKKEEVYKDIENIILNSENGFDIFSDKLDYLNLILKPIFETLCAIYLYNKDNDWSNDSVLKFHLTNGAIIHRINWLGDTSKKGFKQSLGFMVNYYYDLATVEKNHESFIDNEKAKSYMINGLLRKRVLKY